MRDHHLEIYEAVIVDETTVFSLQELCEICGIQTEFIVSLVEQGVIKPVGQVPEQWIFSGTALSYSKTALRLQRDLGINVEGIALVLELLDELQMLRNQIKLLERSSK